LQINFIHKDQKIECLSPKNCRSMIR